MLELMVVIAIMGLATAGVSLAMRDTEGEQLSREAERLAAEREQTGKSMSVIDVIKALTLAADPPKRSGSPKESGKPETVSTPAGKPILRIDGADRKGVRLTLLNKGGASRQEAEEALKAMRIKHDQTLLLRDAANACDGGVAFPCGGVHQFALVHGCGEAQLVVVTTRQSKFKTFVPS